MLLNFEDFRSKWNSFNVSTTRSNRISMTTRAPRTSATTRSHRTTFATRTTATTRSTRTTETTRPARTTATTRSTRTTFATRTTTSATTSTAPPVVTTETTFTTRNFENSTKTTKFIGPITTISTTLFTSYSHLSSSSASTSETVSDFIWNSYQIAGFLFFATLLVTFTAIYFYCGDSDDNRTSKTRPRNSRQRSKKIEIKNKKKDGDSNRANPLSSSASIAETSKTATKQLKRYQTRCDIMKYLHPQSVKSGKKADEEQPDPVFRNSMTTLSLERLLQSRQRIRIADLTPPNRLTSGPKRLRLLPESKHSTQLSNNYNNNTKNTAKISPDKKIRDLKKETFITSIYGNVSVTPKKSD